MVAPVVVLLRGPRALAAVLVPERPAAPVAQAPERVRAPALESDETVARQPRAVHTPSPPPRARKPGRSRACEPTHAGMWRTDNAHNAPQTPEKKWGEAAGL